MNDAPRESTPWPNSPEELLRARYQAFVEGDVDFVIKSHHPETRDQVQREAVTSWSQKSNWRGLELHETRNEGEHCHIHFTVFYERKQERIPHTEWAEFRQHEGQWYYYDSEFPKPETLRRDTPKAGRNDPCPCGSGKKYKKCHALSDG